MDKFSLKGKVALVTGANSEERGACRSICIRKCLAKRTACLESESRRHSTSNFDHGRIKPALFRIIKLETKAECRRTVHDEVCWPSGIGAVRS